MVKPFSQAVSHNPGTNVSGDTGKPSKIERIGVWRSLVSASVWGTEGPRFKSGHPDFH
jgi:hypothetical protein